jgi:L-alanine-DL-glutamate epimerase-like enolase superfamily enzyme
MKITEVVATAISIPRSSKLTTSYGSWTGATTVLVELKTDEGITGIGQASVDAPFYGESVEGMLVNIRAHLAPAMIGESPFDITRLNAKMNAALPHHWFSHSGVEMALWDLKGKALGVPIHQLLGGRVRAGLTLMGFVHHDTPDAMAAQASDTVARRGFQVMKMKIGLDPGEDLKRYAAVAEAVAGKAVIQADGNIGYTLHQAIPTLKRMEAIGSLGTVEQPVARVADMADLARRLDTPVMADEAIYPPSDAIEIVRQKAASVALMKISKHGGIDNVARIGAIFGAAGLSLSIAIYYDLIAVAAAHLAAALPCVTWPSPATGLDDTIVATPFEPDGLTLAAPDGPGLGVELDWDKVGRYALDL